MKLRILHTGDLHGKLTPSKMAQIKRLRPEVDLYFDCGDAVKVGNLGVPLGREVVWDLLAEAGCDAGTIGNRESHPFEAAFRAKIEGVRHQLLCANLFDKEGNRPLEPWVLVEKKGVKIGLFGLMVPMVTRSMKASLASAFLWEPPLLIAGKAVQELRPKVDLLIALTHIGLSEDLKLAESYPEVDLVLGSHSHTVMSQPQRVGNTWVCHSGSHARFVGRYVWVLGRGLDSAEWLLLVGRDSL